MSDHSRLQGSTGNAVVGGVVTARSGTLREVLSLSAPMVMAFVSFSMMGVVDTVIMGRMGTVEQGAVSFGSFLSWVLAVVFTATLTVVNTFVAQDFGAGLTHRLRVHVNTAFAVIPVFALAVWATIPALPWLIGVMGSDAAVSPHVLTYVRIRLIGVPFIFIVFTMTSYLRGQGDMWTPMVATIVANVVNAAAAIVLVFGWGVIPPLGVRGAAIGTLIGGLTESLIYFAVYFGARHHRLYQTRSIEAPTRAQLYRFAAVGLPIGFAWGFENLAWLLFCVYASTQDPFALAANMIVFQIIQFSFLPAAAVSIVGTTLVGQYLGARRKDLAKRSARITVLVGVGYMAAVGLIFGLARHPLMSAFNPDFRVVDIGVHLVVIAALFQPFDALGLMIAGVLRGAGDTRYPMIVMAISGAFVFMPGIWFFGEKLGLGVVGAWIAALVHVMTYAGFQFARYRRGVWLTM
ncbi:MAG: MATE family efflux transporter [Deltaproteobacteria bacterium]|nr:MATE family efflux transporter [Deltaproteobacteria bacterium]